jgi:hypothetical protein
MWQKKGHHPGELCCQTLHTFAGRHIQENQYHIGISHAFHGIGFCFIADINPFLDWNC